MVQQAPMSQLRRCSNDIGDCVEEGADQLMPPRRSFINEPSMLAYNYPSGQDHDCYPPLPRLSFSSPFGSGHDLTPTQHAITNPSLQHQHAIHPHYEHYYNLQSAPCLPRGRPSLQLNTNSHTIEPTMMMRPQIYYQQTYPHAQPFGFQGSTPGLNHDPASASMTSTDMPLNSNTDTFYTPQMWPSNLSNFNMTDADDRSLSSDEIYDIQDEEVEESYDRPYAQLIYEALLQAPGNRMLLRDIYEWFVQNTSKARESGTNGWQNSIRHNLSMNQAFENDKNDPAASRGARKANSMWVLTEHAKNFGVQSTTRYRKSGTAKKSTANRVPAVQRQRSGAKGGRAAKRTARIKRCQQGIQRGHMARLPIASPATYSTSRSPLSAVPDQWSTYSYSPATPSEDNFFGSSYSLPQRSYPQHDADMDVKCEMQSCLETDDELCQILAASNKSLDDLSRL